eukprot:5249663-Prymnesium_polylepis.1
MLSHALRGQPSGKRTARPRTRPLVAAVNARPLCHVLGGAHACFARRSRVRCWQCSVALAAQTE